jgi:uncharacterized protein
MRRFSIAAMGTDSVNQHPSSEPFRPAWWLPGGHFETVWPNLVRPRQALVLRRERITLPDGDFLALDWGPDPGGPIVLLLHGLAGGSGSAYAIRLMRALHAQGFWAGTMHFRGAAGEPNRKLRSYHMAEVDDPGFVFRYLRRKYSRRALAAVGVSLGGSALLHSLAGMEEGAGPRVAVAISVPFRLPDAEQRLNRGLSKLYQWYILGHLKRQWHRKCRVLARMDLCKGLHEIRTFREFDSRITAPFHGFADVDDYYARASSIHVLSNIRVPTLLIQARNDPFMTPESLPDAAGLSRQVTLESLARGGHAGFLEGSGRSYLERRVPQFLRQHLEQDREAGIRPTEGES